MKRIFTLLSIILLPFVTFALNVTWNFNTATPSSAAVPNLTVSALSQGNNNVSGVNPPLLNASSPSTYSGASGTNNAGIAARIGALNTGSSGSAYFEFTLTPSGSNTVNITGISFGSRSTSTGPTTFTVRTSIDNYGSDYALGTLGSTWAIQSTTPSIVSGVSTALTLRIYGYNGAGGAVAGTANWRIDDLSLTLTVEAAVPAPVELKNIKVSKKNNTNVLTWQTASENNNSHFDIERSDDGVKFSPLNAVKGHGTTNIVQDYTFTDDAPLKNINYYRLRQVDFDGKETVSKTVSINFDGKGQGKAKVYPTLVKDVVNIELAQDTKAEISVRDLTGRVVLTQNTEGATNTSLNLSNLNSGMYLLSIRTNEGVETVKIQKY